MDLIRFGNRDRDHNSALYARKPGYHTLAFPKKGRRYVGRIALTLQLATMTN